MTLILSGTDNSVSSPAVQGGTGGTTTGVYYPATNQLALATNGTQAVLVDSSQNVGIGNSSPTYKLDVLVTTNNGIRTTSSAGQQSYLGNTAGAAVVGTLNNYSFGVITNGSTALTVGTNQAITVANTGNGITYSSSGGSGLRIYGAGGTHQWDLYLNGANIRLGDNTGGGAFQLDSNLNFGSSNGGIVFNNSSATTNSTLNDYETGTWTPSVYAASGSASGLNASGNYVKIGRVVHVNFHLDFSKNTLSGQLAIGSLPFTSGASTTRQGLVCSEWYQGTFGTTCFVTGVIPTGAVTYMLIYGFSSTGGADATFQASGINNTPMYMTFSGTYYTNF